MSNSRIFVGNLNLNIKEKHLINKFSSYGNIKNVEIKSKLDIEGEPLSKFAYVSLESNPAQINSCIYDLDGSTLKGSVIKVEVARESFLERLKREREQNALEKSDDKFQPSYNDSANSYSFDFNSHESQEKDHKRKHGLHYSLTEEISSPNKRFRDDFQYYQDDDDSNYLNDGDNNKRKFENDRKKDISQQAKPFSAFTRYDPTASESIQDKKKRKDVTKNQNAKKMVQVSSDLKFKGEPSSSFSLLAMFGRKRDDDDDDSTGGMENNTVKPEMSTPSQPAPQTPFRKPRKFFIDSITPEMQAAVDWLTRPLTDEMKAEFEAIRPHLISSYKHRRQDAEKKSEKSFRGRKKKFWQTRNKT